MKPDELTQLSSLAAKGLSLVSGVGRRILTHLVALTAAAVSYSTLFVPGGLPVAGCVALILSVYIGGVCLFPRGMGLRAAWLIPTGLGLFQCLLWALWGVPWQCTILFGGALTWLVRLLAKKGGMGWEWAALPWLLIALAGFFAELAPLIRTSLPFWTLPVLALGGWGCLLLYTRLAYEPLHRKLLRAACGRLEALPPSLPERVRPSLKKLAEQSRALDKALPKIDAPAAAFIISLDALVTRLEHYPGSSDAAQSLAVESELLSKAVGQRLREHAASLKAEQSPPLDPALAARLEGFRKQANDLAAKKDAIPESMRTHIDGIVASTGSILDCMRTDPQDVGPGGKFLSRYLGAAHTVIDEHIRLSRQGDNHEAVIRALARSRDLLQRLEQAFADEHGRLLQNDTLNFTAELNVLDKLLKMEGR